MYKLKYHIENLDKFINKDQYEDLAYGDKIMYKEVVSIQGTSEGYINEERVEYENSNQNLQYLVNQFYD